MMPFFTAFVVGEQEESNRISHLFDDQDAANVQAVPCDGLNGKIVIERFTLIRYPDLDDPYSHSNGVVDVIDIHYILFAFRCKNRTKFDTGPCHTHMFRARMTVITD